MNLSESLSRRPTGALKATLWGLLFASVALLLVRGTAPAASPGGSRDFALIYSCVLGWVEGVNPYDSPGLDDTWRRRADTDRWLPSDRRSSDNLYPPSTIATLSPLYLLTWRQAQLAWATMNTLMVGVIVWSLLQLGRLPFQSVGGMLLATFAFAWAPTSTAVSHGQTPLPVLAAVTCGHVLRLRGTWVTSGVLFGVAGVLKPQIGLVFLAYEVFRLRGREAVVGFTTMLALASIGILRLRAAGVDWVSSLARNLAAFRGPGGVSDPTAGSRVRSQLTQLHVPLHALIEDRAVVGALSLAIIGAISLLFFLIWLRRREDCRELITLSMACPLLLLVVYHRSYDAVVLLIPVTWAISSLRDGVAFLRRPALLTLLCAGVFFVPGGAGVAWMRAQGMINDRFASTLFYQLIVEAHQAVALLVMCGALLWALWSLPKAPAQWLGRTPANDDVSSSAAPA